MIANTPNPPYYAVIFSSIKTTEDPDYARTADAMIELACLQDGNLGVESARNELGLTVSYWDNIDSILKWKQNSEHLTAQKKGITTWYQKYKVRIAKVERDYDFNR